MSLADQLQKILDRVHRGFTYADDIDQHGLVEWWAPVTDDPKLVGDCEEFARKCCVLSRKEGLRARLVLCGVNNPKGDHLVCEVEGYILDNRSKWVQPRGRVKYHWVSVSGYAPGDPWRKIDA